MDYFLQKVGGRPPGRLSPCGAAPLSKLRQCSRCKTKCAPPCRTRSSSCRIRWKTLPAICALGCALARGSRGGWGAYLILRLCGQSSENYAAFLGVPQSQWQHWANADSAVVHPDWRGNGLQRAMLEAALPLLPPQITHLGLPLARTTVTACATHRLPALSSAAAGRCTAATTAICWKSSCNSMQFWCTTILKCVILIRYE